MLFNNGDKAQRNSALEDYLISRELLTLSSSTSNPLVVGLEDAILWYSLLEQCKEFHLSILTQSGKRRRCYPAANRRTRLKDRSLSNVVQEHNNSPGLAHSVKQSSEVYLCKDNRFSSPGGLGRMTDGQRRWWGNDNLSRPCEILLATTLVFGQPR